MRMGYRVWTYQHANYGDQEGDLYDPPEDENDAAEHLDDLTGFLAIADANSGFS